MHATNADWTIAFGTIGLGAATLVLALAAIFQDHIRRFLWHPKLGVTSVAAPPDCLAIPLHVNEVFASASVYLRVRVTNGGNTPAQNVEVFATELRRRDKSGHWHRVPTFLPMNLCWADRGPQIYLPFIGPKAFRFCDLGRVADPANRDAAGDDNPALHLDDQTTSLRFITVITPTHRGNIIPPGDYQLDLSIGASNVDSFGRTVELTLAGEWYPDESKMLSDGIGVHVLPQG